MSALELALRVLPVEARARYREEATADLAELHGLRRWTYLLGMLVTAPALRHAVRRPKVGLDGHRIRLRCRLGFHKWHTECTSDGKPFRRCERCGADNDGTDQPYLVAAAIGGSGYRATQ